MKTWSKVVLLLSLIILIVLGEGLFIAVTNWTEHPAPCEGCPSIPVPPYYVQYLQTIWAILCLVNVLFSVLYTYVVKVAYPEKKIPKWKFSFVIFLEMTIWVTSVILVLYVSW
jgi:hypothetical protein